MPAKHPQTKRSETPPAPAEEGRQSITYVCNAMPTFSVRRHYFVGGKFTTDDPEVQELIESLDDYGIRIFMQDEPPPKRQALEPNKPPPPNPPPADKLAETRVGGVSQGAVGTLTQAGGNHGS